jgi:hypothetical protein
MNSKLFRLNILDFLKGLLMAILVPALIVIQTSLEAGQLTLDWKIIATTSLAGGIGYLLKNLLSGEKKINIQSVGGELPPTDDEEGGIV